MTERSYFHDGTAQSHASAAPYTVDQFARLTALVHATSGKYVLPEELNNLEVTSPGGTATVNVNSGKAFIEGYWYENDASVSLTIAANASTYGRWDRIIVEIDTEAETATLRVLQGVPARTPDPPTLNTCATKLQLSLARVYMPAAGVQTQSYYVHDERHFANNAYHQNYCSTNNDFPNHRFLGWGDSTNSFAKTGTIRQPMPGWTPITGGAGSDLRAAPLFDSMGWGRCVENYYAANRGDGWETVLLSNENVATMTTLRFLIRVDTGYVVISYGGVTLRMPPCATEQEVIIRASLSGYQTLSFANDSYDFVWTEDANQFVFGDFRLSQGYVIASEDTPFDQYVFYNNPTLNEKIEDAYTVPPTSLVNLSTGNQAILFADWGTDDDEDGIIADFYYIPSFLNGIKAFILRLRANDSGSAGAANTNVRLRGNRRTSVTEYLMRGEIGNEANDQEKYFLSVFPLEKELSPGALVSYNASGAGTLDVQLAIVGVVI